VSISYGVPSSGSYTVTATVTDSVLYSASDSTTVNFTVAGPVGSPLTLSSATASGGTTTISWSGGTGPYTVKNGPITVCTKPAGETSCTAPSALAPKNSTVTLTDSAGGSDSKKVSG
jgi:hypothetical protein